MKKFLILITAATALSFGQAAVPLEPLPSQYGAIGMSFDPTTSPGISGDVEWGKLITDSSKDLGTYLGASANLIPNSDKSVTVTAIQAKGRQIIYRNPKIALVVDTSAGISNNGTSTAGVFSGGFGAVFGKLNIFGVPMRFFAGGKSISTTNAGTKVGPVFSLVFTPKG